MASQKPTPAAPKDSLEHIYPAKHFTRAQLSRLIGLHNAGMLTSVYGSVERVEMAEALVKIVNDRKMWTVFEKLDEGRNVKAILLPEKQIAGWLHGVVQAWQREGERPVADADRAMLLELARSLKCSGRLLSKLPKIADEDVKSIEPMDDAGDVPMDP